MGLRLSSLKNLLMPSNLTIKGERCTVKVIEDSYHTSTPGLHRVTTLQLKYPRMIHAEFMTHRVFSRNASSTRAIPTNKLADRAFEEMVIPMRWGKNQKGMQASEQNLSPEDAEKAFKIWEQMASVCANGAKALADLGLHKQWAGRSLEWFSDIDVIVTASQWDNFFMLRNHPDAQPEIQDLAVAMESAIMESVPSRLEVGQWHLPYVSFDERNDSFFKNNADKQLLQKVSAARCCRVSYLKHDGQVPSIQDDLDLYERLAGSNPKHMSPLEHQACPPGNYSGTYLGKEFAGNLHGWVQYRKLVE